MSTSKHIDKLCIAAVCLTLVLTLMFMCGGNLGITSVAQAMPYESTLFDTSYVHKIDIVMDDWDTFIDTCESEEYSSCTVVIDGKQHKNIAIRAKGNTSLSNVRSLGSQRYSFKLEFDHYESGKTCDGLDKLCLNNLIQDNTMMKDYLVYQMMDDFGVDAPLSSFAYLTVNGEDWGLYLAVESVEDSFLSRNYGSDTGELYKPDSTGFGGGRGNGKDFNMDQFDFNGSDMQRNTEAGSEQQGAFPRMPNGGVPQGGFPQMPSEDGRQDGSPQMPNSGNQRGGCPQIPGGMGGGMGSDDVKLKYIDDDPDSYANIFDSAKTDVSSADEMRLISALKKLSEYSDLEDALDMDEVLRYFVVHNFVCNGDSYTGSMIHNYYLHEKDGKLGMIPWDYNLAFGTFQGGNVSETISASIDSPVSGGNVDDRPMVGWIFSDEAYTDQYHQLFSEFIEKWFANGELASMVEDTAEMLRPYVETDPTKFCTTEEFDAGVKALSEFVTLRGEAVSRQLNGDNTAVDASDLNLSDMGTMNRGMGGGIDRDFQPLSMLSIMDKDGNKVDTSDIIGDISSIASATLSDGTTVNLSSFDPNTMRQLDFTKIVSVTHKDGHVTDLSGYVISFSMNGMQGGNRFTPFANNEQNQNSGQRGQRPEGNMNLPSRGDPLSGNPSGTSDVAKWWLVGMSVVVLAAGLVITLKKKD